MKTSVHRVLTTHTGSLPRPPHVPLPGTAAATPGAEATGAQLRDAVAETVQRQVDAGIDIVNDGEMSKPSYATYVATRLSGFGGSGAGVLTLTDLEDFPDYAQRMFGDPALQQALTSPACDGPIAYRGHAEVERDIANLKAATQGKDVTETFLTAASPGVIAVFMQNQYFATEEQYIAALADAMKEEYDAVHRAGLLLQIDCPDLAMGYHIAGTGGGTIDEFRRKVAQRVEALNHATRDIPADRLRMHMCWGNYEGPHNHDIPLASVLDLVLQARPQGLSFEAANPRHEHEWRVFEDVELPDDKVLIPGVLDSTTNYIEHPELVAERIERFAHLVGTERVIAGTDCGFATFAQLLTVEPHITWAKLSAMAEGAKLASDRLSQPR